MFPKAKPRGTLQVEGKKLTVSPRPISKCLVIPPNSKLRKTFFYFNCRRPAPNFGARSDHVHVQSSSCYFPIDFVSFDP